MTKEQIELKIKEILEKDKRLTGATATITYSNKKNK